MDLEKQDSTGPGQHHVNSAFVYKLTMAPMNWLQKGQARTKGILLTLNIRNRYGRRNQWEVYSLFGEVMAFR